jgi:hypothetical protein
MRKSAWISILGAVAAQVAVVQVAEAGQSDGVFIGVIRDASTGAGIEGAVVVVVGEKLQGERTVTTDSSGVYRLPNLPPGAYDLTVLHSNYGEGKRRKGLVLRANTTIRVDISLMPVGEGDVRTIIIPAPTVDVGSSSTGLSIDKEMAKRVPIIAPGGKGSVNRSFEAVAEATPGAQSDTYGTSIAGSTSPENQYTIDGMSVNNPAYGINGSGLSIEFVEEVKVEVGGYMPEFGRSTGGVINATTKRGSNELHGGAWMFYTPGQLEGRRLIPRRDGDTIQTERLLNWQGDAGFDVGGKIVKDKLWFYAGFQIGRQVYDLRSSWNRQVVDPSTGCANVIDPSTGQRLPFAPTADDPCAIKGAGFTETERIAGSTRTARAQATTIQAIGKLTYAPAKNHTIDLTGIFMPTLSGGADSYGIRAETGLPEVGNLNGDFSAQAHRYRSDATDILSRWSATSKDKNWLFDTTLGWHHQLDHRLPSDGSRVGSNTGLAAVPGVIYRRGGLPLTDFQDLPTGAPVGACDPFTAPGSMDATTICPIRTYSAGGPGFIYERNLDRIHGRHMVTRFLQGAGHHLLKAGVDAEYIQYTNNRGYSGGTLYRENVAGTSFTDYRQQGFLVGPDDAVILGNIQYTTFASTVGAFIQDSWSVMDKVTINAGLRYDAQHLFAADRSLALALPNQISPRVGVIWDPTYEGKAKIFGNYARFYQSVPLDIADRAGSGEPGLISVHPKGGCDPLDIDQHLGPCRSDSGRAQLGGSTEPDQLWIPYGGNKTPIDPRLKAQSTDEIVGGAEYEFLQDVRLGAVYTRRWMNRVIEDMSRDEANTYFIGNPGYGIAADFPKPTRNYDAVQLFIDKRFTDNWLLHGSYTLSWLRGNYAGLFRPETGQLDPNINSDFDLISLLDNRQGYLPADSRHAFKVFSSGVVPMRNGHALELGGAFRATSGGPTSYFGSHELYGPDEAFILPRGVGERLPWRFSIDPRIAYVKQITKDVTFSLIMEVYNVANFQTAIAVDQTYTFSDVKPIKGGTVDDLKNLKDVYDEDVLKNPNFGNPVLYQLPRQFRFGARFNF